MLGAAAVEVARQYGVISPDGATVAGRCSLTCLIWLDIFFANHTRPFGCVFL